MKANFTFFNEEWNWVETTTEAHLRDDYGDSHEQSIDEIYFDKPRITTIED